MRWLKGLLRLLCCFVPMVLPALGHSQELTYTVPQGPQHFIVMVDASRTMAGAVRGDRNAKPNALRRAERYLADRLFEVKKPWYRRGRDYLTVVDYGFDTRTDASDAFKRLSYANLGSDYVRVRLQASRDVDRSAFLHAVRPTVRRSLNVLGWAFPMCLDAAAVPGKDVQITTVLMLNDALTNDGSIVLERYNLGMHLSAAGRRNLRRAEERVWGAVRVGDAFGTARPLWQEIFPARSEQIVVTALRLAPTTTLGKLDAFRDSEPLKDAELAWGGGGLVFDADIPKSLVGRKGTVSLTVGKASLSAPVDLDRRTRVVLKGNLRPTKSVSGRLKLSVADSANNEVLGRQRFSIDFIRAALVPAHPDYTLLSRFLGFLLWSAPLVLAGFAFWVLYERLLAQRVFVELPEYPPFPIPNPSANLERPYQTRVPTPPETRALGLRLPHPWIQRLAYPGAILKWDELLRLPGIEGNTALLADLPRRLDFLWTHRPAKAGELRLEIERPAFGGVQRVAALVRYPSWQRLAMNESSPPILGGEPRRDIVVSLDLGSESTAAFAQLPDDREPRPLHLQHYLRAFAADPDLLTVGKSKASHRLRTRFFANDSFRTSESFRKRDFETHTEILPESHPLLEIVDYDAFDSSEPGAAYTPYAQNLERCFFRFVTSSSTPNDHRTLLPNAKLVFQTGADFSRNYTLQFDGQPIHAKIHPVELISNQVCLVLQNFVRHEPGLAAAVGDACWRRFAIVLTVPNTYSPFHRDLLKQLVEEKLDGSDVHIITESDAIVYYYTSEDKPNLGLEKSPSAVGATELYLTLDVGKGTTDLSLIVVGYESNGKVIRQRVTNTASNGRASGGAKITYAVARYFEALMDLGFAEYLKTIPNAPDYTKMPYRLTTFGEKPLPQDSSLTRCLLAFERHCESFKHGLTKKEQALQAPDVSQSPEVATVAAYMAVEIAAYLRNEDKLAFDLDQQATLGERLKAVLQQPLTVAGGEEAWARLGRQVDAYVTENVDTVLRELINAYLKPNSTRRLDTLPALKALVGNSRNRRTHLIVSGQGSLFAPLRDRLLELATQAGLPVVDESTLKSWAVGKVPTWAKGQWWRFESEKKNRPQYRNVMVLLDDKNLKDGCSRGALHWYLESPESTNPHAVGGQLVVRAQSGANPRSIPMDDLNEGAEVVLPEEFLQQEAAWEVYYLPCRGLDIDQAGEAGTTPIARLRKTKEITFRNEKGSIVIETDQTRRNLESTIYEADNNQRLRAMVWPNVLLPGEPKEE